MTTKTQGTTATEEKKDGAQNGASSSSNSRKQKTLNALLEEGLKDIYSAEQQLVEALPKMMEAADSEELQDAIETHLEQTKKHVSRLEKIFDRLGVSKNSQEKCVAMEGLIEEGNKIISEFERSPVRDSALIIGAQKIEHYEIAAYGSLRELADVLREDKIVDILQRTLDEEEETDQLLTEIAQEVNDEAYEMSEQE